MLEAAAKRICSDCIMLAKYREKELAKIAGEAEVKRLHTRLCELVPHREHCEKAR